MMKDLREGKWFALSEPIQFEKAIRQYFGSSYLFKSWRETRSRTRVPILTDGITGIDWVLAPGGTFSYGLSANEYSAALRLTREPFLTLDEMRPCRVVEVSPFLISATPVSKGFYNHSADETIGPLDVMLCDDAKALEIAREAQASLPSEIEWEYACRAGTASLFWFGDEIPSADEMEDILGLTDVVCANNFGLSSMLFGEWCADIWRSSLDPAASADASAGRVIRGGAARFWPWQDPREWSGCASAFRMPSKDSGNAGAAIRVVRRPSKSSEQSK